MKVAHHNAKVIIAHEQNSCCGLKMSSHIRAGSKNYYCQDNAEMTKEAASDCAKGDQDECELLPYLAQATADSCTR